jgi:hypothetical protein
LGSGELDYGSAMNLESRRNDDLADLRVRRQLLTDEGVVSGHDTRSALNVMEGLVSGGLGAVKEISFEAVEGMIVRTVEVVDFTAIGEMVVKSIKETSLMAVKDVFVVSGISLF